MKYFSLLSSPERLGANEVHRLLMSDDWGVVTLRNNTGEIFDNNDHCLGLNRIKVFSLLYPVFYLLRFFPKGSFILADGIFPILIAKIISMLRRDIQFVALIHNDYTINNRTRWKAIPDPVFNIVYRLILSTCSSLVTTSDAALKALQREGFKNVSCVDNIVESGTLPERGSKEVPDFWFIGRLVSAKNVRDILHVARKRNYLNFNIVGDGPEYDSLSDDCPGNVRFFGYVNEPFQLVSQGDVFMLPSSIEGKSLAVMRAASSGLLLCLSDIAENRFVSELPGCFFHEVRNADSILQSVDNIVSFSRSQRESMAAENKILIDRELDLDAFRLKYKALFS